MFDFGRANDEQRKAITETDGPVLIIAGPGTGKTFTLVKRAAYLILEKGVKPESILISTFTEKAAKEIITRITDELDKGPVRKQLEEKNIDINLNEMYIGTFHSICLRILKENMDISGLRKNFRTLDEFEQQYLVYTNISRFIGNSQKNIPPIKDVGLALTLQKTSRNGYVYNTPLWDIAAEICRNVDRISEELIEPAELIASEDRAVAAGGRILKMYNTILDEENCIDFSNMQIKALRMLQNNPSVLDELRSKITHIMIDEYQDTNYVQEQLAFLLAGDKKNICVVGDDDQGLYRFRGATIRNILEFGKNIGSTKPPIKLETNYRSDPDIIDFYNKWMDPQINRSAADSSEGITFSWSRGNDRFRYDKTIVPCEDKIKLKDARGNNGSPAVVRLTVPVGKDSQDQWNLKILQFINKLMSSGKIKDYNQIAFLFHSVGSGNAIPLAGYLERNGISVYNPRSNMFFQREEIKVALGCLILMFPQFIATLVANSEEPYKYQDDPTDMYFLMMQTALDVLRKPENADLNKWINEMQALHADLPEDSNTTYSELLYKMFSFDYFVRILDTDLRLGTKDLRPVRNLSILTSLITKYEYICNITKLKKDFIEYDTWRLFYDYLKYQRKSRVSEYEDNSEYAPSGCVSFLTMHQAKGLEFPVVFVCSLSETPWETQEKLLPLVEPYFHRQQFEPKENIAAFDFWRKYYTAFSRAQDLLVLPSVAGTSKPFAPMYSTLTDITDKRFDPGQFTFESVKPTNLKSNFSFTSHISIYDYCSLQYKFYSELGFTHVRAGAMMFGTLVHETIEDIHRAAMRGEAHTITNENIEKWFLTNYELLSKSEHQYLDPIRREEALKQIKRYARFNANDWCNIRNAEVDVSIAKPDYIIEGTVDLIRADNDTVEIEDFKTMPKPKDKNGSELIEKFRKQLQIYSYLVEKRTGQKVSKMSIYFTSEDKDHKITFPFDRDSVDKTMAVFDDTVHKILNKDFSTVAKDRKVCQNCDFRDYCKKKKYIK